MSGNGNGVNGQVFPYWFSCSAYFFCSPIFKHDFNIQNNEKLLQRWLDHELEVMVNVHEVRYEYEKQSQVYVVPNFSAVAYVGIYTCNFWYYFVNRCWLLFRRAALAEELAVLRQVDEFASNDVSPPRGKTGVFRWILNNEISLSLGEHTHTYTNREFRMMKMMFQIWISIKFSEIMLILHLLLSGHLHCHQVQECRELLLLKAWSVFHQIHLLQWLHSFLKLKNVSAASLVVGAGTSCVQWGMPKTCSTTSSLILVMQSIHN